MAVKVILKPLHSMLYTRRGRIKIAIASVHMAAQVVVILPASAGLTGLREEKKDMNFPCPKYQHIKV